MLDKLYHTDNIVASCNACGAYTLTRNSRYIKHYDNCGGIEEVRKWGTYYSSLGWKRAVGAAALWDYIPRLATYESWRDTLRWVF